MGVVRKRCRWRHLQRYTTEGATGTSMSPFFGLTAPPWFGPNKPAADMEGNGEFDFMEIFEDSWRISWRFLEIF